jgi:cobaltochelatase CobN
LQGLSRRPLSAGELRRDVNFVTSGLFRDLYENLIVWLDRAVLLALDGASETIRREHSALVPALEAALGPLGEMRSPDDEPLDANLVAAHWVESARALIASGQPAREAGRAASLRLFGNAPGGYGAGVNNLVERSGSWEDRKELARAFGLRMGHAYGIGVRGAPSREVFEQSLARTEHTYLGRASRLYGLLDNNDSFDYLGGLRLAVEAKRGAAPISNVVQYADVDHARVESVERALFSELRGRHLNPAYLKALVEHGYAGARSLSFGFVENLWGWQVTSPDLVEPWVWDEVHAVYLQDRHQLGMDKLWKTAGSSQVKANIEAVLLVAAQRGFWSPGEPTLEALAQDFAELVAAQGLPGSGHTRPDHPVMAFIRERVRGATRAAFERTLEQAQRSPTTAPAAPASVAEVRPATPRAQSGETMSATLAGSVGRWLTASILSCCVGLFIGGIWRGRR